MFEIKTVLEQVGRGVSRSEVERVTRHTRKTIGRYVRRTEQLGWRIGAPARTTSLVRWRARMVSRAIAVRAIPSSCCLRNPPPAN